jgi:hypothetical protein
MGGEQDDVMIDIVAEPEGVEPPLLDTEQTWMGFEISPSFPFSTKVVNESQYMPASPHFILGHKGHDKKKKDGKGHMEPKPFRFCSPSYQTLLKKN